MKRVGGKYHAAYSMPGVLVAGTRTLWATQIAQSLRVLCWPDALCREAAGSPDYIHLKDPSLGPSQHQADSGLASALKTYTAEVDL